MEEIVYFIDWNLLNSEVDMLREASLRDGYHDRNTISMVVDYDMPAVSKLDDVQIRMGIEMVIDHAIETESTELAHLRNCYHSFWETKYTYDSASDIVTPYTIRFVVNAILSLTEALVPEACMGGQYVLRKVTRGEGGVFLHVVLKE